MSGKFTVVRKVEFGWWATTTTWAVGPQIQRWAGRWSLSLFVLCLELYVTWPCKRKTKAYSGTFVPDRDTGGAAHR